MLTYGEVSNYADLVTIGTDFSTTDSSGDTVNLLSNYLIPGADGDIVFINSLGLAQYIKGAKANTAYRVSAKRVVSGATVNGSARTTTATDIVYLASPTAS